MFNLLKRLRRDQGGQDVAEYGICLVIIALVLVIATHSMYTQVGTLWQRVVNNATETTD